jgi:protein-S-isoprenylcysteine O-methyltransferase Ste14
MRNKIFNYSTLALVYFAFFFTVIKYFTAHALVNSYTYIGLILMTVSLVFLTMARIKLGDSFQVSAEANNLVKSGIYKTIRHPLYVFSFTFVMGFLIFIQVFYGLIFLFVLIVLQLKRIKKEEAVLIEKFGDEYVEYKKQTWF